MRTGSIDGHSTHSDDRAVDDIVVRVDGVAKRWPAAAWWMRGRQCERADILANVSFAVRRGEIFIVLGENGAGKSTLLKIVAGLASPTTGTVNVLGCDVRSAPAAVRRRVAYAGGERGFYFRLTARENLAFFGALDGLNAREVRRRITDVARIVDISAVLDTRFAKLSTGMRQRLGFARALIRDTDVLLLDEPTHALDPLHAAELRRFMRDALVGRFRKTLIVATNLIDEAVELGDRVAVLRSQKLTFVEARNGRCDEFLIRRHLGMPLGA